VIEVAAEAERLGFDVVAEIGHTFVVSGHDGSATFTLSDDRKDLRVVSMDWIGDAAEWLPFVWLRYAIEGRCFDIDKSLFWYANHGELTKMHMLATCGLDVSSACEVV